MTRFACQRLCVLCHCDMGLVTTHMHEGPCREEAHAEMIPSCPHWLMHLACECRTPCGYPSPPSCSKRAHSSRSGCRPMAWSSTTTLVSPLTCGPSECTHARTHTHTHIHSLSLYLSRTHTLPLSLSLTLTHTHMHMHTQSTFRPQMSGSWSGWGRGPPLWCTRQYLLGRKSTSPSRR